LSTYVAATGVAFSRVGAGTPSAAAIKHDRRISQGLRQVVRQQEAAGPGADRLPGIGFRG
jgi:hypothetical protein